MKLSGGDDRVAEGHESRREAPSGGGVLGRGVPLPRDGGPGVSPPGKFWNLRRNLVQSGAFWQEIDGSPTAAKRTPPEGELMVLLQEGSKFVFGGGGGSPPLRGGWINPCSVWNSLSYNCRSADVLSTFKRILKTELSAVFLAVWEYSYDPVRSELYLVRLGWRYTADEFSRT